MIMYKFVLQSQLSYIYFSAICITHGYVMKQAIFPILYIKYIQ